MMTQKIRKDKRLGNNIRNLRLNAHMTQEAVVTQLQLHGIDISRSIYSQIECGTYNIRVEEIVALSKLFQVDYNVFFDNLDRIE